jgi:hypothetical protein
MMRCFKAVHAPNMNGIIEINGQITNNAAICVQAERKKEKL